MSKSDSGFFWDNFFFSEADGGGLKALVDCPLKKKNFFYGFH